MKQNIKPRKS